MPINLSELFSRRVEGQSCAACSESERERPRARLLVSLGFIGEGITREVRDLRLAFVAHSPKTGD